MTKLTGLILDLIANYSDEEARDALAEVVNEFDLHVAANLIKQNVDPLALTKGYLEDYFYSEGNDQAGQLPITDILSAAEEIINADDYAKQKIQFEKHPVRRATEEEIEKEILGKGIVWYKLDEEVDFKQIELAFEAM